MSDLPQRARIFFFTPSPPPRVLIRRQSGAIVTFMVVSVSEKPARQSLRLDQEVWQKIDRERSVSRNTWITEAILEKLS